MIQRIATLAAFFLLLFAAPARAETINALIEGAAQTDGQTVTVEGEVIGDVMIRGDHGWINMSDGTNDIGVWAPAVALREVRYAGRYHQTGDRVRVSGLFRRADPEFGGDLVIRANSVEVVARGALAQHTIPAGRPLVTLGALVIAAALGALRWKARATS